MAAPTLMNRQQVSQARDLRDLWSDYGPALRARAAYAGGMTWKTVNKAEYLCRYWQDETTGKKKFTSLGRRSPETEALYRHFTDGRTAAAATVAEYSEAVRLAGRLAKAHGLARMPSRNADLLRAAWLSGLMDEHLVTLGGAALHAYELGAEILAPVNLTRETSLTFLARRRIDEELLWQIGSVCEDVAGKTVHRAGKRHRVTIGPEDGSFQIVMFEKDWVRDRFEAETDAGVDVLDEALDDQSYVSGVVVARDSKPVEIKAPDPRAYAVIAFAMGRRDGGLEVDRARYVAAMVHDHWPETFDRRQEAAFPSLFADNGRGGFGFRGP